MNLRLLATPLVAATLLLSVLGCSKKEDPVAKVENIASYMLDGQTKTCVASQIVSSQSPMDYLTIRLTTVPEPSSGPETLDIRLWKRTDGSGGDYEFMPVSGGMLLNTHNRAYQYGYFYKTATRAFASDRSISGTFEGENINSTGPGTYTVVHTITAGIFTNVKP
jgi:hypothetical protein